MKNSILDELDFNLKEMEDLIRSQKFNVVDAHKYLSRYYNVYRSLEDLIKSRDNWKKKYMELKELKE